MSYVLFRRTVQLRNFKNIKLYSTMDFDAFEAWSFHLDDQTGTALWNSGDRFWSRGQPFKAASSSPWMRGRSRMFHIGSRRRTPPQSRSFCGQSLTFFCLICMNRDKCQMQMLFLARPKRRRPGTWRVQISQGQKKIKASTFILFV